MISLNLCYNITGPEYKINGEKFKKLLKDTNYN